MQRNGMFVFLLLLCIAKCQAQTTPIPTWNGDPKLCTINGPVTPAPDPQPAPPKFPTKAEFGLERVEIKRVPLLNLTLPSEMTLYEYLYDYDANSLIMVRNKNGFIEADYFYYNRLIKSTYIGGQYCTVMDIPTNQDMDGASAIQFPNGTWHIRPLDQFLLFSNTGPNLPFITSYLGRSTVRGIPVYNWQSCYINRTDYRTVRRIWSFAQETVQMPGSTQDGYSIPVQALISASYDFPNGTQQVEFDEIYNVHSFRPGIMESSVALAPPKGVFCGSGAGGQLVSLKDVGVEWPDHFSVRVESSTSRSSRWERFHLRYSLGRESGARRLRYDFLPPGAEDFQTVIHDYSDSLTYTLDRRVGTCQITPGVDIPDVSPILDPIRFFVKHEARFIFNPPQNAWEFNGFRKCRSNAITCTILTTSIDSFPVMVDPETGVPETETWLATNVEYGWSTRAPLASIPPGQTRKFDYPVNLYLRMYRFRNPSNPSAADLRVEDVQYEFYEMTSERYPDDFDISSCYRALNYEYLHLFFSLKASQNNAVDRSWLNRRSLTIATERRLIDATKTKFTRIADLEIDHEAAGNDVQVFFTLLGQTPMPGSPSGLNPNEPTAAAARDSLQQAIDSGNFQIQVDTNNGTAVQFTAIRGSLKYSKQYISIHSTASKTSEKYSGSAIAAAVIVGLLIGLIVGIAIVIGIRVYRKEPLPAALTSFSNPLPKINFSKAGSAAASSSNA